MELGRTQKALMELRSHQPIIFNKLLKLYRFNPSGVFSDIEVQQAGLTDDDLKVLQNYGVFKRVNKR